MKAEELAKQLEYAAKCADMGRKPLDDDFRRLSAAELRRQSSEIERLRSALQGLLDVLDDTDGFLMEEVNAATRALLEKSE